MAEAEIDVQEEYFENTPTGVEAEAENDDGGTVRPWDPSDIRVSTRQFSLRNILDLIDDRDLELAPDFQRNQVWKARQKFRLIETILLQIPLPAFYFSEDTDGMMRVVDGLQRLSTVHSFVRGGPQSFGLRDLEYLDVDGKRFDELPTATGGPFRDHIRMDDREVVLRFCAFWLRGVDGYVTEGSMDAFLETTTAMLDDPERVPDARLEELHSAFNNATINSRRVFGAHAFRKWPLGSSRNNPINRPCSNAGPLSSRVTMSPTWKLARLTSSTPPAG